MSHYPHRTRGSYSPAQDGPPVLVVKVASESTYRADLDRERGKGWSYAKAGLAEYLVLDPTRVFVPEGGRSWRLEGSWGTGIRSYGSERARPVNATFDHIRQDFGCPKVELTRHYANTRRPKDFFAAP